MNDVFLETFSECLDQEKWIAWSDVDGRKLPINPWSRHCEMASSTDSLTWSHYEQAIRCVEAFGLSGVGFVFTEDDPYIGIDLDDCRDPKTGAVDRWARRVVDKIDSYTEVSPSGTGLKIWCRGELSRAYKDNEQGVEVYPSRRYFTVTGELFGSGPTTIERAQKGLDWLTDRYFDQPKVSELAGELFNSSTVDLDIDDWVSDALEHIHPDGGGANDYDQWLNVGMALHEGFNGSTDGRQLWERWSRQSSHYDADEIRKKWRSFGDYSGSPVTPGTIWKLASDEGWGFEPEQNDFNEWDGFESPEVDGAGKPDDEDFSESCDSDDADEESGDAFEMTWYDAADLYCDRSDYEPHLVEPGVIGTSDIAMIFGPPKSMKTMATMAMCRQWSAGKPWLDLEPQRPLRIAYLNFEIKRDNLRRRLHLADLKREDIDTMRGNLWITDRFVDTLTPEFIARCVDSLKDGPPGGGRWNLIVVDPIIDIFPGDSENDNKAVKDFIKGLRILAHNVDEDAALLLVHHANKTSRDERHSEPFNALRGGSAFRGSYDTGMALGWESERRETLRLSFECRNGPGLDNRQLQWVEDDGRFVMVGQMDGANTSERVAGESVGEQWDREHWRKAHVICELLRSEAECGIVHTRRSFSNKFASTDHGLGSSRTIERKIGEMAQKGVIGFFDASDYGGPSKHPNSAGHIVCEDMVVGCGEDGQIASVEDADGVVETVDTKWVRVEGYPDPLPVGQVSDFEGLKSIDELYSGRL